MQKRASSIQGQAEKEILPPSRVRKRFSLPIQTMASVDISVLRPEDVPLPPETEDEFLDPEETREPTPPFTKPTQTADATNTPEIIEDTDTPNITDATETTSPADNATIPSSASPGLRRFAGSVSPEPLRFPINSALIPSSMSPEPPRFATEDDEIVAIVENGAPQYPRHSVRSSPRIGMAAAAARERSARVRGPGGNKNIYDISLLPFTIPPLTRALPGDLHSASSVSTSAFGNSPGPLTPRFDMATPEPMILVPNSAVSMPSPELRTGLEGLGVKAQDDLQKGKLPW